MGVSCWLRKKGARYLNSEVIAVYYLTCNTACRLPSGTRALSHKARAHSKSRAIPHPEKGRSPTELFQLFESRDTAMIQESEGKARGVAASKSHA